MFGRLSDALKKVDASHIDQLLDKAEPLLSQVGVGGNRDAAVGQQPPQGLAVVNQEQHRQYAQQAGGGRHTRALLIGINYAGTDSALRGCIQDVTNMNSFIGSANVFQEVLILTDDQQDPQRRPTRQNILSAFQWLVSGAQPGDAFFLHYSGHGSRQKDTDGDEVDGYDETIVPLDYQQAGQITDDEMNALLVRPLPKGARLTCVFDCCHSGSGIDLPYTYSIDGNLQITFRDNTKEIVRHGLQAGLAMFKKDHQSAAREAFQAISLLAQPKGNPEQHDAAYKKTVAEKGSDADILMFSGCKDEQTSADAVIEGQATGAMSWALLAVLREVPNPNLADLLRRLREKLYGKYQQIPQMSTAHQIDVLNSVFFLG
ncbi:hypothetical protein HK105_205169 [Polyrhizophydium stewartii]|uniref:Peptidase C14 caspase domain-containing protein n=1 Tax=Polyrhizophydium stewartii TaxID=2732419 RepID=A0ABR4N761_9FUNG|nr:Ca(2+)-dependent cysteine protease [Polyrhizophydium stewartii]